MSLSHTYSSSPSSDGALSMAPLPPPLSAHHHRRAVVTGCDVVQLKGKTRQVGAASRGMEPVPVPLGCLQAVQGPEGTVVGSDMVSQSLHPGSTALGTKGSDILFLQSAERLQGVPDLKTHAWLMLTTCVPKSWPRAALGGLCKQRSTLPCSRQLHNPTSGCEIPWEHPQ